jgi:hypothetical protein
MAQCSMLLLRSCLSSCVAVLSNLLLSGVCKRCQYIRSILFSLLFCLINIGQPYVLSVSVCSGVAFQPDLILSMTNFTVTSISYSISRETFEVSFSLMRCLKSSQFVCLLLKLCCSSWFNACAFSVIKTGE